MRTTTRLERVHNEFSDELNKMWDKCGRQITKVSLTRQIANQMRQNNKKTPKYIVNYWPMSNKKVRVY